MKKQVQVVVADAAGNVTIFVKTPFDRSRYAAVASQLLANQDLGGEQVAFICSEDGIGKMEMCGLEFCGNASRTFGLMLAEQRGIKGTGTVEINVSGCDENLLVNVDTLSGWARIKMPGYVSIKELDLSHLQLGIGDANDSAKVPAIDFGGILHIILKDVQATEKNFNTIKDLVYQTPELSHVPALGVMFYDTFQGKMTPVVYVKEVDTTYFEGSCGSGTTACAVAFFNGKEDGIYEETFLQPAGAIHVLAQVNNGKVGDIYIDSPISYSETLDVEIEI